ncbi:hypothetical protein [Haloprofundus salilacus]|uniref:hypothetical protein n=1 Tax=Haloprofundus salilacus TaxID=2876190 RepID=UPI001CCA7333|nr:hypothetical protein [Haloprofundus salilacus]
MYFEFDPVVPRWAKLFLVTALLISPLGVIVGSYITGLLYDPNYVYLLDVDAARFDGALYQFPYESFIEIEVLDGKLDDVASNLYIGKNVDIEAMTVEGTWRGSMTDRELLTAVTKIWEFRYLLEPDAREGFKLNTSLWGIVRSATVDTTLHVIDTFEKGSLPDEGHGIEQAVDRVLEEYDVDRSVQEEMKDVGLDPEEVDLTPPDEDADSAVPPEPSEQVVANGESA